MNLATVALTPAQKGAKAPLLGGRVSVALAELKRRLKTELPPQIAHQNEILGLTGNATIEAPKGYAIAPLGALAAGHVGHVLVGASIEKVPSGTRAFRNQVMLHVYLIGERAETETQTLQRHDLAEIVGITLYPYLVGCADESGRMCWRELVYRDSGPLPGDWKQFSGLAMNFLLVQSPSDDTWGA